MNEKPFIWMVGGLIIGFLIANIKKSINSSSYSRSLKIKGMGGGSSPVYMCQCVGDEDWYRPCDVPCSECCPWETVDETI